jgi:hypothetical protein
LEAKACKKKTVACSAGKILARQIATSFPKSSVGFAKRIRRFDTQQKFEISPWPQRGAAAQEQTSRRPSLILQSPQQNFNGKDFKL